MSESKFLKPKGDAVMKDCFVELNELYTSIQDMDRVCNNPSSEETKLEDVLFAVKNIDTSQYKDEYVETIVNAIRKALVDLYTKKIAEINNSINVNTNITDSAEITKFESKKQINISSNTERGAI